MLKYVDTLVGFKEVPSEITLCINISNCKCHCKNCHSPYLAEDIGEELNIESLFNLIANNEGITCVAFLGGDNNPKEINNLAKEVKTYYNLKTAWYSGRQELSKDIDIKNFNLIKLGPYIEEFGPLNSKTTNQKFYKVVQVACGDGTIEYKLIDITYKFHERRTD